MVEVGLVTATNRGGKPSPQEFYPTPGWCVRRLLEALELPGGWWLEPAAGEGAIMRAVSGVRADVTWRAVELRDACYRSLTHYTPNVVTGNFLHATDQVILDGAAPRFRVAITNPPFSLAEEFVKRMLTLADWVIVLERLSWLSGPRAKWMRSMMPDVYVLPDRPSFLVRQPWETQKGTDSADYGWYVWRVPADLSYGKVRILASTPKAERRRLLSLVPAPPPT